MRWTWTPKCTKKAISFINVSDGAGRAGDLMHIPLIQFIKAENVLLSNNLQIERKTRHRTGGKNAKAFTRNTLFSAY